MWGISKVTAALAALSLATPAQTATCWSDASYQAAQMRDFDTMLMVATLRCRIKDMDFSADYNRFVRQKRAILLAANVELRSQFASSVGPVRALGAYDDFMTKIANGYGGGAAGVTCADYAAWTRAAVEAPVARLALVALAERAGARPKVPGQRCSVKFALKDRR